MAVTHSTFDAAALPAARRVHRPPANWPLAVGALLVLLTLAAAVFGPALAPQDPLARTSVIQVGDSWVGPPYPLGTPGFLLGSDSAGRDLFSRLLWAVRPTMIMVTLIAFVRLLIGLAVGLAAGWSRGPLGRWLDHATGLALAAPVLIVALATIAFIGIQRGLIAFVVGLSLTGWADTARYVEAQTRATRSQAYIEAAYSVGASDRRILFNHVLRQVLPLAGMLFAFEVSSVLMVTAGLGFLGYYIGGGVWIIVSDFAAVSAAGAPELGQMLATSLEQILRPWVMVLVGLVVITIILGFTLLGEGLRRRLHGESGQRAGKIDTLFDWISDRAATRSAMRSARSAAAAPRPRARPRPAPWAIALLTTTALLIVMTGAAVWQTLQGSQANSAGEAGGVLSAPGGHLWSGSRGAPYGALEIAGRGPAAPVLVWSFADEGGFAGGPAVAADGTVYVGSKANALIAVDGESGAEKWRAALPAPAAGAPAIGPDGTVYVADDERGLSAVSPQGDVLWRAAWGGRRPQAGPIVGPDGVIYIAPVDRIHALSPQGETLWSSPAIEGYAEEPPRLAPNGKLIFLLNEAFSTADGSRVELLPPLPPDQMYLTPKFASGGNGEIYRMVGLSAQQVVLQGSQGALGETRTWELQGFNIFAPTDSGVTQSNVFWLFFGTDFTQARMAWLDPAGKPLRNVAIDFPSAEMVGIDSAGIAYACLSIGQTTCYALSPNQDTPLWTIDVAGRDTPGSAATTRGRPSGALAEGRLYISTPDGHLHLVADESQSGK